MAQDALLPGDPGRALALAQELLTEPLMSNHARGLWGYTGGLEAGGELTVQSTGIGAASGAVVLAELAGLGVDRAVRVGTCTALPAPAGHGPAEPGDVVIAERVIPVDGVSSALAPRGASGGLELLEPDRLLTAALVEHVDGTPAVLAGIDPVTPASARVELDEETAFGSAAASDFQAAALVAVGQRVGIAVGCVDLVVESEDGSELLDDDAIASRSIEIGKSVVEALSAVISTSSRG